MFNLLNTKKRQCKSNINKLDESTFGNEAIVYPQYVTTWKKGLILICYRVIELSEGPKSYNV